MSDTEYKIITGKVHKFGDNINTDLIIPATHLVTTDENELGSHLMEGEDPQFRAKVTEGDIIVGGKDFGSGSSREHAPLAIKGGGISCVIAASFARIFFRNCINVGLVVVESPEISESTNDGDELRVDLKEGKVENLTSGSSFSIAQYPEFMEKIINAGGLINYLIQTGA
ncbi:MAG: 3-isopropylmalate dehydratase small subunit [Actinobacteria bacterium]|nr:3-isopropylmalate dehydratase small subunit [Actinomycetota bacterium]